MGDPASILLVDDDRLMQMTLRHRLSREGYHVDLASEASEAMDLLGRHDYDLVLADIRAWEGCGLEVVKLARRVAPATAILLLAGSADPAEVEEALRAGAEAVLVKPCELAELIREARNLVARRRPHPAP